MRHAKNLTLILAALLTILALGACGGSEDEAAVVRGQLEPLPSTPAGEEAVAGEATLKRTDEGTDVSLRVTGLQPGSEYVAHLHTGGCDQADPGGPHFKFDAGGSDQPPNEIHLEFKTDADGAGRASAASEREVPSGEAGSIVVHEADGAEMTSSHGAGAAAVLVHEGHDHDEAEAGPQKVACAELEGGRSPGSTGEESASRGGKVPTVLVRDGEPVGGIAELEYSAGDQVRFEVTSDVADDVHVHGYDLLEPVPAGGTASFDFPAEIEGIFEIELEGAGVQIAELRVNP